MIESAPSLLLPFPRCSAQPGVRNCCYLFFILLYHCRELDGALELNCLLDGFFASILIYLNYFGAAELWLVAVVSNLRHGLVSSVMLGKFYTVDICGNPVTPILSVCQVISRLSNRHV